MVATIAALRVIQANDMVQEDGLSPEDLAALVEFFEILISIADENTQTTT